MDSGRAFLVGGVDPPVRGFIHDPGGDPRGGVVLTHGAGANCESKLLVALAAAFAEAGFMVLRCDLPFRQMRPYGPPSPGSAERDRMGLKCAVESLRQKTAGPIYLGGHSYGGRQASMLAADEPGIAAGLLLFSYPLHPPRRPEQLRTAHWPKLSTPVMFVHGSRDPFATLQEMESAMALLRGRHTLLEIDGAGHELLGRKANPKFGAEVVAAFTQFVALDRAANARE
jgi:predicted alpha/beta-hydrolase family hydrolase